MNKIQNFPIMLFTTIMGLGGLSMDIFYIFGAGFLFESFRFVTAALLPCFLSATAQKFCFLETL